MWRSCAKCPERQQGRGARHRDAALKPLRAGKLVVLPGLPLAVDGVLASGGIVRVDHNEIGTVIFQDMGQQNFIVRDSADVRTGHVILTHRQDTLPVIPPRNLSEPDTGLGRGCEAATGRRDGALWIPYAVDHAGPGLPGYGVDGVQQTTAAREVRPVREYDETDTVCLPGTVMPGDPRIQAAEPVVVQP